MRLSTRFHMLNRLGPLLLAKHRTGLDPDECQEVRFRDQGLADSFVKGPEAMPDKLGQRASDRLALMSASGSEADPRRLGSHPLCAGVKVPAFKEGMTASHPCQSYCHLGVSARCPRKVGACA